MLLLCREPLSQARVQAIAWDRRLNIQGSDAGEWPAVSWRPGLLSQRTGSYLPSLVLICVYPQNKMFRSVYSPFGQNKKKI